MLLLGRQRLLFPVLSGCVLILLLVNSALGASDSLEDLNLSYKIAQPLELTPKLSLQLKLHAFLLWSSVGFLMPVGVLLIRISSNVRSAKSVRVLFYCHVASQIAAVVSGGARNILVQLLDRCYSTGSTRGSSATGRGAGHRRRGSLGEKLRERVQQHPPEDRARPLRTHLAPAGHRLPQTRQGREGEERVVPGALAAGHRGVRGGGGQRVHRPPHVPGEDREERQALDGATHRGGVGGGARLPPPGQVEPRHAAAARRNRRRRRRAVRDDDGGAGVPVQRSQGGGRDAVERRWERAVHAR